MDRAWGFIKDNADAINKMFASGQFLLGRILKSVRCVSRMCVRVWSWSSVLRLLMCVAIRQATSAFASEAKAAEVEAFFKDKDTPGADRSISQALETIRLNAA